MTKRSTTAGDFAPFREVIRDCVCASCCAVRTANRCRPWAVDALALALLVSLQDGSHVTTRTVPELGRIPRPPRHVSISSGLGVGIGGRL